MSGQARVVAVGAAVALAVSLLPASAAAQASTQSTAPACSDAPAGRYWDVAGTHAAAVDCVGWWGIARGVDHARYRPSGTVTRGQMAAFIARTVTVTRGALPSSPPDAFDDDNGTTHERSINQLAALGVVRGVRPGEYRPAGSVTRAQMATFLANAWEARTGEALPRGGSSFGDTDGNAHRANIERVASAGFAAGTGGGRYDPSGLVTRGQMATFLARFVAKVVADGHTTNPPDNPVPLPGPQPVFATVGAVELRQPSPDVEMIGFHEARHAGARQLSPTSAGARKTTMPSRGRGTGSRSSADVVAAPDLPVLAPVTGRVVRAGSYPLYCRYSDHFVVIEPETRSGWEVTVLHFEGLRVRSGDEVTASRTVLGDRPRTLPLRSQVDRYSHPRDWPHVHVEVVDPSVPHEPESC